MNLWKTLSCVVLAAASVCSASFAQPGAVTPGPNAQAQAAEAAPSRASREPFRVFLSLAYPDIPNDLPGKIGAESLYCFSQSPFFWDTAPTPSARPLTPARIRRGLSIIDESVMKYGDPYWPFGKSGHLCLDWSNFWNLAGQGPVDASDTLLTITRANLRKFTESAQRIRAALREVGQEGVQFGFRGVAPIDLWTPALGNPESAAYEPLAAAHRLQEMTDFVASVDFLLATTQLPAKPTTINWVSIENSLKLAREIKQDKPLYIVLTPHLAGVPGYIDEVNWQRQLELARRYGDGVVISASYQVPGADKTWNPESAWWRSVLAWLDRSR